MDAFSAKPLVALTTGKTFPLWRVGWRHPNGYHTVRISFSLRSAEVSILLPLRIDPTIILSSSDHTRCLNLFATRSWIYLLLRKHKRKLAGQWNLELTHCNLEHLKIHQLKMLQYRPTLSSQALPA